MALLCPLVTKVTSTLLVRLYSSSSLPSTSPCPPCDPSCSPCTWSFWQVSDLCPLLYTLVADVAVDWTLVERVSIAGWIWLSSAVLVGLMLLAVGALLGEFTMAVCW